MAEGADYDPGAWKGHDFTAARKAYDVNAGRSYADAKTAGKTALDCVPASIETQSESPVIINCDVTGSMGDWPGTIFSKLPYLDIEGKQYLGPTMEIAFAAVGDAHGDKYPFQIRNFTSGTDMTKQLKELIVEGGGGGTNQESYELAALYGARNVKMPKATKPIMIFIGDEHLYDFVTKSEAKNIHVNIEGSRIDTTDIFEELKRKFAVYAIRKPNSSHEAEVHRQWVKLLGDDHVAMLQTADRVVDVIFGMFARETNSVDYFRSELEGRQRPDQVDTVYKSLKTVHANLVGAPTPTKGKSVMLLPKGKKTKGLLSK